MERRKALNSMFVAGAGLILAPRLSFAAPAELESPGAPIPNAFSSERKPKPLPFGAGKLKGISEKLIQSHWENNYAGAVKALNATEKALSEAVANKDLSPALYSEMKREHLLRTGSVVLHEIYFGNLGGDGKVAGEISSAFKTSFGSAEKWEAEFRKIGQGLGGGSGWVILGYNLQLRELENYWSADHAHNAPATIPILAMDMYEHSYQMDYGAAAAKYIDAFFQNINWQVADERLKLARQMKWA